jgi:hypothetical protein
MPSLFGLQGSQIVLLLGVGLFVVAMLARMRRNFTRDNHQERTTIRGTIANRAKHKPAELEMWEVEMVSLARRLTAEIDTKMQALERLIQLADDACDRLHAAVGETPSGDESREAEWSRHHHRSILPAENTENSQATTGITKGESRRLPSALSRAAWGDAESSADNPRFERVYALADAGFSAVRIASHTGAQVGEVELILSLRAAG